MSGGQSIILGKDKLDARLQSMCMNAGVSENRMNLMGDNGLNTVALMAHTFTDKSDLRDTFQKAPFDLSGTDLPTKLIIGKAASVYVAALENDTVQVKTDAERVLQNLPPQIPPQSLEVLRKLFDKTFKKIPLDKAKTPSKPYFERKFLQCETAFESEPLTMVTNKHQEEAHASLPNYSFDS